MKIIERYIALHTLGGVLVVLSLFAIVFSFMELLIQINDVGKGSYQLADYRDDDTEKILEAAAVTRLPRSVAQRTIDLDQSDRGHMQRNREVHRPRVRRHDQTRFRAECGEHPQRLRPQDACAGR